MIIISPDANCVKNNPFCGGFIHNDGSFTPETMAPKLVELIESVKNGANWPEQENKNKKSPWQSCPNRKQIAEHGQAIPIFSHQ